MMMRNDHIVVRNIATYILVFKCFKIGEINFKFLIN